jgi:hypothetical protein
MFWSHLIKFIFYVLVQKINKYIQYSKGLYQDHLIWFYKKSTKEKPDDPEKNKQEYC